MAGAAVAGGSAHFHCGWIPTGGVKLVRTSRATPRRRHIGARLDDSRRDNRRRRSAWDPGERGRPVLRRIVSGCVRGFGRSREGVWHAKVIGSLHASSRSLRARQLMPRGRRPERGGKPQVFSGALRRRRYATVFVSTPLVPSFPLRQSTNAERRAKAVRSKR